MSSTTSDEIIIDHFRLKSRGLLIFRATYQDGSTVLWVGRHENLDFFFALQLQKLRAKKKGR